MADVTAGAARYASVAEVRADVERAGGDASVLCGFGRCFCVKTAAFHLHGGRLHRQQPAGSRIRPGRHARLPQADGRANYRRYSRRGGSAAAWRASAQRVSVGDSSSSAGSFFYTVLSARAESLGLRLSLDSVGGLLRVAMLLVVARVSAVQERALHSSIIKSHDWSSCQLSWC